MQSHSSVDDAVDDGVDVMSLSLGVSIPIPSETSMHDELSYGAFHATSKGIPVICGGGNDGPGAYTVTNIPPWIITVAATSLDRWYPTPLSLGNNVTLLARTPIKGKEFQGELMYVSSADELTSAANGKVVLAFLSERGDTAGDYFAKFKYPTMKGLIISAKRSDIFIVSENFPYIKIDYEQGATMFKYITSTRFPTIRVSSAITLTGPLVATKVPGFSARGPNSVSPYVLKPDVAAPGMSIVAATTPREEATGFVAKTGTSMSTPVVTGVVVLLRAVHPDWSPAAIRSALVTTASTTDPYGEPIFAEGSSQKLADPFDYGGGLVNPAKATDPGLVYDASSEDYLHFLCASGYDEASINKIGNRTTRCPSPSPSMLDLNLPSITIPFLKEDVTLTRTVTNVGPVNSIYKVMVQPPLGVKITITPEILAFSSSVKKLSFDVRVSTTHKANSIYYFGSITWTDGAHDVTIPVSVRTQSQHFSY